MKPVEMESQRTSLARGPQICVCMPAYKAADTLLRAIESVRAQHYDWCTVYVCVRAEDAETIAAAQQCGPGVEILLQKGRGIGDARNTVLQEVAADEYYFLDADDYLLPGTFSRYLADREQYSGPCLRYGAALKLNADGANIGRTMPVPRGQSARFWLRVENYIGTGSVMISREVLRTVGVFDTQLSHGEDWLMWLRIAASFPIRHIPGISYVYRDTKLTQIKPRHFWYQEDDIIDLSGSNKIERVLGKLLVRGRYGLYRVRSHGASLARADGFRLIFELLAVFPVLLLRSARQLIFGWYRWMDVSLHNADGSKQTTQ